MFRGRLLFPFRATVHRLDTRSVDVAGGYDPDFRTLRHEYPGGVGVRVGTRREFDPVELVCQVEIGKWGQQRQMASGNAPDTSITLVFHFIELEEKGLVDAASGDALIRVNDRLSKLTRLRDGALVQRILEPGMFATESQIGGMGQGGDRNLLIVTFDYRAQGLTTPPG